MIDFIYLLVEFIEFGTYEEFKFSSYDSHMFYEEPDYGTLIEYDNIIWDRVLNIDFNIR